MRELMDSGLPSRLRLNRPFPGHQKKLEGVNGFRCFIKFDGSNKVTSFGLLSESGLKQTTKWECVLSE